MAHNKNARTSAFEKWFIAQHGGRTHTPELDDDLRVKIIAGEDARQELLRREIWDHRYSSALYAWRINDADKATYVAEK